jgi:hypothetical protein
MKACVEVYHVKVRLAEISRSSHQTTSLLLYKRQGRIAFYSLFPLLIRNKRNCSRFLINCLH